MYVFSKQHKQDAPHFAILNNLPSLFIAGLGKFAPPVQQQQAIK